MDRSDHKDDPARTGSCARGCIATKPAPHGPSPASASSPPLAWSRRLLSAALTAAALLVGFNALIQALNVLAAWWRHVG